MTKLAVNDKFATSFYFTMSREIKLLKTIQAVFISFFLFSSLVYSSTISINNFKSLKQGMSSDEVINILGKPDYVTGSGFTIFVYKLLDDSSVWLGFGNKLIYVKHRLIDGKDVELLTSEKP